VQTICLNSNQTLPIGGDEIIVFLELMQILTIILLSSVDMSNIYLFPFMYR
jgi:hypothetical protein